MRGFNFILWLLWPIQFLHYESLPFLDALDDSVSESKVTPSDVWHVLQQMQLVERVGFMLICDALLNFNQVHSASSVATGYVSIL